MDHHNPVPHALEVPPLNALLQTLACAGYAYHVSPVQVRPCIPLHAARAQRHAGAVSEVVQAASAAHYYSCFQARRR
jgi:hypothetical protein